jgi:hypothetical protein
MNNYIYSCINIIRKQKNENHFSKKEGKGKGENDREGREGRRKKDFGRSAVIIQPQQ